MQIRKMMLAAIMMMPLPAVAQEFDIDALFSPQVVIAGPTVKIGRYVLHRIPAARFERARRFATRFHRVRKVRIGGVYEMVTRSAIAHGLPPALAHGVVRVESNYNCAAYNRSGASGIMQVLPRTAAGVGVRGGLRSCGAGLEAGMRYLRQAYQAAGGNICQAATLFNQGLYGRGRCSSYGRMVLHRMASL